MYQDSNTIFEYSAHLLVLSQDCPTPNPKLCKQNLTKV